MKQVICKLNITPLIYGLLIKLLLIICLVQATAQNIPSQAGEPVIKQDNFFLNRALKDTTCFYYTDLKADRQLSPCLPIGVFDSGTGGLTVLDAILKYDNFDSCRNSYHQNGDGIKDFANEHFIYFGDQANMPYGNYPKMSRTDFLKELILRDALFLLGNKYYNQSTDTVWQTDKNSAKLIVIACNTATAFGKEDIENMLSTAGSKIKVIGVIDAGVRGALSTFGISESGSAAVMATAGTVSSNGYMNTFYALTNNHGYKGQFEFIQQAGLGIAEAIDEEINFIDRNAKKIRDNYEGPSLTNKSLKIREELLPVYNFDTTGNALLYDKVYGRYLELQLNSAENYIRYYLVNLCEQLKMNAVKSPLKTLILGCTHYPFYTSFFQSTLKELYNLEVNGKYIYREVLSDSIILVDPAVNTAREVHEYLIKNNLLNKMICEPQGNEFYISVPNLKTEGIETDSGNNFTYAYKYSRDINHFNDIKQVPFSRQSVNEDVLLRIQQQLPEIYEMIRLFEIEKGK